ncbi:hypothetical protein SK128_024594, partial [Halocaridina rubra]
VNRILDGLEALPPPPSPVPLPPPPIRRSVTTAYNYPDLPWVTSCQVTGAGNSTFVLEMTAGKTLHFSQQSQNLLILTFQVLLNNCNRENI